MSKENQDEKNKLVKLLDSFCASVEKCPDCPIREKKCNNFKVLTIDELKYYCNLCGIDLKSNDVNHPTHYNRDGAMETIDEMVELFGIEETMSFCKLNAWKYRARAIEKNGNQDMEKSDWYIRKYAELKVKLRMEETHIGQNL